MSLWGRAQFSNPAWRPVEIESKSGAPRNFEIENFDKLPGSVRYSFLAGCYSWWLSLSGEGGSVMRDGDEYLRHTLEPHTLELRQPGAGFSLKAASCAWSLLLLLSVCATMTCACASTAACAL